MDVKEILKHVDHTLLQPDSTWEEIRGICDDAVKYGTASVCIPPSFVKQAAEYLQGRVPVCTVIGFPNGYNTTAVKVFEAKEALAEGASEIDMVINIGWLKDRRDDLLLEEIRALKAACGDNILKVIIETCMLTEEEKICMCEIVTEAGADYIKTSTGFGGGGATFEDVALFAAHVGPKVKIKAAGGISSLEDAERFLELGADRLGTSRIVKIIKTQEKLRQKYHFSEQMNDGAVLSLFTKKPMDFAFKTAGEEGRNRLIKEIEADFGYHFRKVKRTTEQVHGSRVIAIDEQNLEEETGPADGLVTDLRGVALEIRTADCQSVFLYDPVKKVVGNIHSGWRGTLQGIAVKAVRLMHDKYGCKPEALRVYINPSILQCSFEIEEDVLSQFEAVMDTSKYCRKGDVKEGRQKYYLDTAAINKDALSKEGIPEENIILSGICTVCNSGEYHSYRAQGVSSGRNASLICLK